MKKLIAFDLDGTLTQHKTPLDSEHREMLDALRAAGYRLLMVGAGQCERIYRQMGEYPLDIIGNYGMQYSTVEGGEFKLLCDTVLPCDRASVEERVAFLREKHGFTVYAGESVEFHPSGCVTFAILGTKAKQEDKLAFDPDRRRRRAIYREVVELFPEYVVFVGGSSSFDMAPRPYDKYYALTDYCRTHGIAEDEVVFVGDDYGEGGNDEAVLRGGIDFVKIDDYRETPEKLAFLLK